jgi:NADH-quinone oxidoreductase subunit N
LAGLGWTGGPVRPVLAWTIAVFMFSLAGIPPLAGFWGKLALFASALSVENVQEVRNWFVVLAVIGALNAAIAAAYYLRIVGVMFFRMPLATPEIRQRAAGPLLAVLLCGTLVVVIGLSPRFFLTSANKASPSRVVSLPQQEFNWGLAKKPSEN